MVIKVGGSLLDWPELGDRLAALVARLRGEDSAGAGKVLLLAGGGAVADFVREMDRIHWLGDARAHWLAIRALDFNAELLASLLPGARMVHRPEELESIWNLGLIPILAPRRMLEEIDARGPNPLPASWEITSDSIAARIALYLGARRLILVKSALVPEETTREAAARLGLVDPMFPVIARELESVEIVSPRGAETCSRVLPH